MKKIKYVLPALVLFIIIALIILGFINKQFFIISGLLLFIITFGEFVFYLITEKGSLDIKTPDGSNEPFHPSLCYIDKDGWKGYNYWMAFTPYPIKSKIYRDRFECPCVVVSNDGLKWKYLNGKEYIDDLTNNQIAEMDYFSDPELVFINNKMYCYYRLSTGKSSLNIKKVEFFRKTTIDGVNWSEREKIQFVFGKEFNYEIVCPTIIVKNNKYYMWFVAGKKWHRKVYQCFSKNGIVWDGLIECSLNGNNLDPWHIDCKFINGIYLLIVYDMTERITIWESTDGIKYDYKKKGILPSGRLYSFYRATLYRASVLFDGNYKLYFSAGNARRNSIGLMAGISIDNLKVQNVPFGIYRIKDFIEGWVEKYLLPYSVFIKKVRKLLCQK